MTDMKKNIKRTAVLSVVLVLMFAITVFGAEQTEEYVPAVYATFWALVPPVVAIGLALYHKRGVQFPVHRCSYGWNPVFRFQL